MKGPDDRPLLLLNRKGEGRVGMLLSDQGWLWARGFEGGGPHVALYRRIAHWLMQEPELEEERLTADGRGMVLDIRRQTMSDDPGPSRVITPSGKAIDVPLTSAEPGLFTGSLETTEIGLYQIGNGDLSALAHIGPVNAPEFADTVSTEQVLKPTAEATGGSVRRLAGADRRLPALDRAGARPRRCGRPRLDRPAHHQRQRAQIGFAGADVRRLFRACPASLRVRLDVVSRGAVADDAGAHSSGSVVNISG